MSAAVNLILYYLGFGFPLFLVWGMVLSEAVYANRPTSVRRATTALRIIGFAHPAAALAAWDLSRFQERVGDEAPTSTRRDQLALYASLAIAALVIVSHRHETKDVAVFESVRRLLPFA